MWCTRFGSVLSECRDLLRHGSCGGVRGFQARTLNMLLARPEWCRGCRSSIRHSNVESQRSVFIAPWRGRQGRCDALDPGLTIGRFGMVRIVPIPDSCIAAKKRTIRSPRRRGRAASESNACTGNSAGFAPRSILSMWYDDHGVTRGAISSRISRRASPHNWWIHIERESLRITAKSGLPFGWASMRGSAGHPPKIQLHPGAVAPTPGAPVFANFLKRRARASYVPIEPIRTYGSCHHVDGSSPSDLRDCDRAPLNVLSTRACARTYPRHSPASPDCARLCPPA